MSLSNREEGESRRRKNPSGPNVWRSGDPGEEQEHLPSHDISRVSQRLAVNLVLLPGSVDAGAVEWTPSVYHGPSEQALLSEVDSGGES